MLELKRAALGTETPASVIVEIDDLRKEIAELGTRLGQTGPGQASDAHQGEMVQVQIVMVGDYSQFTPEKRDLAVAAFAAIAGIPVSQVKFLKAAPSSIKLTLKMPADAGKDLLELFSKGDPYLVELGVTDIKVEDVEDAPLVTSRQPTSRIRIVIVDDHAMLGIGLQMLFESRLGMQVVGTATNSADALELTAREQPDIILLDLALGEDSGIDLLPRLLSVAPDARVILLTGVRDPEQHRRGVVLGAMGLVLKENALDTVTKAIEKVYAGEVWLDRALISSTLDARSQTQYAPDTNAGDLNTAQLSVREREIIALIGEGLRNKQIADRLTISEATVRHHLTAIFAKLGVRDRFELIIYAYRHGLVSLPNS